MERNNQPVSYKLNKEDTLLTTVQSSLNAELEESSSEVKLTNIDSLPKIENVKISFEVLENNNTSDVVNTPTIISFNMPIEWPALKNLNLYEANLIPEPNNTFKQMESSTSNSQILSSTKAYEDLSSAVLPLSLHSKESSLLVDSIVQDMQQVYENTSKTIRDWFLVMQNESHFWFIKLDKFFNQPGTPQKFVRDQAIKQLIVFTEKTAIWLCEGKEPPAEKKTEKPGEAVESPIDKIKKIIENMLSTLKNKMEEIKKAKEDKK